MKKTILFLIIIISVSQFCTSADSISKEKKAAIKEFMEVANSKDALTIFMKEIVKSMTDVLKRSSPDVPEKVLSIIKEETVRIFKKELGSDQFYEIFYPVYAEHYSVKELRELTKFYKSPVGRKLIKTMPIVMQKSIIAGQKWSRSLLPELQKRYIKRFKEEGVWDKIQKDSREAEQK